jgi:hypothetical protein
MSTAGQATPPISNVRFIIDTLADCVKDIGIDLFNNPFTAVLEPSNSLEATSGTLHVTFLGLYELVRAL